MNKNLRIFSFMLTVIMTFCMSSLLASATSEDLNIEEITPTLQIVVYDHQEVTLNLNTGLFDDSEDVGPRGVTIGSGEDAIVYSYPEREKIETFSHHLIDDGIFIADMDITVSGIYSQADDYALINSIDVNFNGSLADYCFANVSLDGDVATVDLYFNGTYYYTFTYKLHTNGYLMQIIPY